MRRTDFGDVRSSVRLWMALRIGFEESFCIALLACCLHCPVPLGRQAYNDAARLMGRGEVPPGLAYERAWARQDERALDLCGWGTDHRLHLFELCSTGWRLVGHPRLQLRPCPRDMRMTAKYALYSIGAWGWRQRLRRDPCLLFGNSGLLCVASRSA